MQYICMNLTMKALDVATLGLHWGDIMITLYDVMLQLCYGYVLVMLWLLLWLCVIQERGCVVATVPIRRE